jgi:hypothetical protein
MARWKRGLKITHWCRACIVAASPGPKEMPTRRLWVPAVRVMRRAIVQEGLFTLEPLRVELIGIGRVLSQRLAIEPTLVHSLSPEQFEEFVCDRISAMGLETHRVGKANQKDGGIDVFFWPRESSSFPFLGAAQIKHHRDLSRKEGPATVREFQGAIGAHPIHAGLIVTNTSFTSDAQWFAREHAKLVKLRDFSDIRRWLLDRFDDGAEWRELPRSIELCPGVTVQIR